MSTNETSKLTYCLQQAHKLAEEDRFDEAFEAIRIAYKFAIEDEVALVEGTEREIEQQRNWRVRELTDELEALLKIPPEELTPEDLQRGAETLASLQGIHPGRVELEELEEGWRAHHRRAKVHRALVETRDALHKLWQAPYVLPSRYDEALALARQKAREFPDEPAFQQLLS